MDYALYKGRSYRGVISTGFGYYFAFFRQFFKQGPDERFVIVFRRVDAGQQAGFRDVGKQPGRC